MLGTVCMCVCVCEREGERENYVQILHSSNRLFSDRKQYEKDEANFIKNKNFKNTNICLKNRKIEDKMLSLCLTNIVFFFPLYIFFTFSIKNMQVLVIKKFIKIFIVKAKNLEPKSSTHFVLGILGFLQFTSTAA